MDVHRENVRTHRENTMITSLLPLGEKAVIKQLREATIRARPSPCCDTEEPGVACVFWENHVRRCIATERYEAAWHGINIAALGERAFTGPDRICKAHGEGLPADLVCRPRAVMRLIHLLYYEMNLRKMFDHPHYSRKRNLVKDMDYFLPEGNRVAALMFRQQDFKHASAGFLALLILDWANNYRRLAVQAS